MRTRKRSYVLLVHNSCMQSDWQGMKREWGCWICLSQDCFIFSDLLANLTALLDELSLNLQELTTAVTHGIVSRELIRSRDYNQAIMMLDDVKSRLNQVKLKLANHIALSEDHRNELRTIESELHTHQTLLKSAGNISRTVSMTAIAVNSINNDIFNLIQQFEVGMLCCRPLLFITL